MNLTVHIGTTKTGSSSLQRFLNGNRAAFRSRGILIPSKLGHVVHFHAAVAALPFGESPDLARTVQLTSEAQHAAFREETCAAFRDEIAHAPECREVVITAEQLHSRLLRTEDVESFHELFCRDFSQIRVVVYVRPQLDQIVSLYSTMLRGGYQESLEKFIESRKEERFRPYFDLRDVITRWTSVFGLENVIVRPIKSIRGEFGVLSDFCDMLEIDLGQGDWRFGEQANVSINLAGQELLQRLNRAGTLNAAQRRELVKWAEAHCSGQGAVPALALAQSFQSLFDESNAWVAGNYFPDHPDYLEPRWPSA